MPGRVSAGRSRQLGPAPLLAGLLAVLRHLVSDEQGQVGEQLLGRAQVGMRRSQSEASYQCAFISSSDATSDRSGERSLGLQGGYQEGTLESSLSMKSVW